MSEVKRCPDCRWSIKPVEFDLFYCTHPKVVKDQVGWLAGVEYDTPCYAAREGWLFASCGVKGKLWEART